VNVHGGVTTGVDLATGQTDNSFGNGTKESDINVTVGTGSIPNSKADLGNFYVANETLANNHVLLYLGWTRVNTSGTTNFDFEINKAAQPDLTTPGPKTLVRTPGDIIINYDFQGGAQKPTLAFRTWQANGTWSDPTPLTGTTGEAEVNRVDLANPLAQPPSPATAPAFTFGEAAIDLTAAGIVAEGDCAPFSSAYVKSRSSDAFTSAVKDFIAPVHVSLSRCGSLSIHKSAKHAASPTGSINHAGVTFTVTNATNGTNVQVVTDASGNACVENLPLSSLDGDYTITETVPAGYTNANPVQTYTVVADTTCASAMVASFVNTPLTNLSVVVDSQIDGGTASTMVCTPPGGSPTATGPNGDGTLALTNLVPGTYTCTIVIDP
jgi:hypothetical protein